MSDAFARGWNLGVIEGREFFADTPRWKRESVLELPSGLAERHRVLSGYVAGIQHILNVKLSEVNDEQAKRVVR